MSAAEVKRTSVGVEGGAVPVVVLPGKVVPGPVVLMVPAAFGVADDVIDVMAQIAESAAAVVALDVFWRDGVGVIPYEDMPALMRRLGSFDRNQAFGDFAAVLSWVRGLPECNGRVVGLGVCLGGPFCFVGAAKGLLEGVVTWHGSRLDSFVGEAEAMGCPMALHFGGSDRVVPMDAVERVRQAFAGRDDVEVIVHAGADHGFSHSSGPTWDPAAAAAGMASVHKMLLG